MMMRNKRVAMAAAAISVFTLALTSCASDGGGGGGSADESADLTVWFMNGDVSDEAQQWLVKEWASEHDGAKLNIEIQDWDGIVTKLQTAMSSESQTPDVVEFGNTQVRTFSSVGALSDISDMTSEIGGDDLIPSLVDNGTYDDKLYAAPLFAGSRIVFYRKSLLEAAGVDVPTSLSEVTSAAAELQKANPEGNPDFEGFFMPALDWGAATGWFFTNGSHYAKQADDGSWVGTLSTDEGQAAMKELQQLYTTGMKTAATATAEEYRAAYAAFNEGRTAMFTSLSLTWDKIDPDVQSDTGVFALPGLTSGTTGEVLAGGSNIGISAKSPNQEYSRELIKLIMGDQFQTFFAQYGWVPGNQAYTAPLNDTEVGPTELEAVAASGATPAAENWAVVESDGLIRDMLVRLAEGEDTMSLATEYDAQIEDILNG